MRHPRIILAGIGLAAVAAVGGITAAFSGGPAAGSGPSAGSGLSTSSGPSASPTAGAATVRTAPVTVAGKTEAILVTTRGLPLYFYRPDRAAKSFVTGGLARLWPPLIAAAPTAAGLNGKLTVLNDAHGHQVAYHGHLLYTFAGDHAGQVTGQGVQDFFVATPGVAQISTSPARAGTAPAVPSGGGYGY